MRSTRILIIDDHQDILAALVKMLSCEFAIVGTLPNGEAGFAHAVALNPDIIILDISLPDISGLEVAKRLRRAGCRSRIIFLSNYRDPEVVRATFDLGASGYVFKSRIISDLTAAIEVALQGAQFVPKGLRHQVAT
jgi:DNA-binding NarL/FixJ family response regulator